VAHYTYLIIGGGMTADSAASGIREVDPEGSIGIISAESNPPYNRPPLTKALWTGKKALDNIWRNTKDRNVDLFLGRKVTQLDPDAQRVVDDQGETFTYDKLLLATGGSPRKLPFGDDRILYYRTVEDYKRLRELTGEGRRFAVIGGGFIGSEIAAALAMNDQDVVMIFPESGISALKFPWELSNYLNEYFREKRVEVLAGELVAGLEFRNDQIVIKTKSGREILVDNIVAGLGIRPNTDLAESAGLETDNGIVVDDFLHTSHPDIFSAGDVASFYNPTLDRRMRVEHEDNANTQGTLAGRNMAHEQLGQELEPYQYLPYFYSDLFDLGYEAVGLLNSDLETHADWEEPYQKGVVYYLQNGRVVGVLLWNVWGQLDAARALMAEAGPFEEEELSGRIPA
jgi:NADPH-dependent 2,4-dienoyl-CoA reductase/sulfur reductase-like enzyme